MDYQLQASVSPANDLADRIAVALRSGPVMGGDDRQIRDLVVDVVQTDQFEHLTAAFTLGNTVRDAFPSDIAFQYALGFAAWVQRKEDQAVEHALRVITLNKNAATGYRLAGLAHLTAGRPTDAYVALSAGMANCEDHAPLILVRNLAAHLMDDRGPIEFFVDGVLYRFAPTCFNSQALEASLNHCVGALTEVLELRYLRDELGHCPVVLEVGTMVGNHTVFFIKSLRPGKLIAFDADIRSICQTRLNCVLNDGPDVQTELVLNHTAVGNEVGHIRLLGSDVELTTLDAAVDEPVDFIKIDADGMEIEVLQGARQLIARCRPRIMIEINRRNIPAFESFLSDVGYVVKRKFDRPIDPNFFVVPSGD